MCSSVPSDYLCSGTKKKKRSLNEMFSLVRVLFFSRCPLPLLYLALRNGAEVFRQEMCFHSGEQKCLDNRSKYHRKEDVSVQSKSWTQLQSVQSAEDTAFHRVTPPRLSALTPLPWQSIILPPRAFSFRLIKRTSFFRLTRRRLFFF